MKSRNWFIAGALLVAVGGLAYATRTHWSSKSAGAQAPAAAPRVVPVEVGEAVKKKTPVVLEALGNVTPIASVAIKARLDTSIVGVHFRDGAHVNKGDLLFTLDCRQIDAQIVTTEGAIARDKAQLTGAQRDVTRYTELVAKAATPVVNLDNAKTQSDVYRAAIKGDEGVLENLKVQRDYCSVTAAISGRISAAAVKVGNFVRQADTAAMAIINQMAPVYVSFTIPQKNLPDIRQAIAAETGAVEVVVPGDRKRASGQVTMIENTIDTATGMATIRATMPNDDELLWPGTLVTVDMTLRSEDAVVVPTSAVQVSQTGTFVFVIKDGVSKVQQVKVERQVGRDTVIGSGLAGGETVVTDGQLLLSDGTHISPRSPKAASGDKSAGS